MFLVFELSTALLAELVLMAKFAVGAAAQDLCILGNDSFHSTMYH